MDSWTIIGNIESTGFWFDSLAVTHAFSKTKNSSIFSDSYLITYFSFCHKILTEFQKKIFYIHFFDFLFWLLFPTTVFQFFFSSILFSQFFPAHIRRGYCRIPISVPSFISRSTTQFPIICYWCKRVGNKIKYDITKKIQKAVTERGSMMIKPGATDAANEPSEENKPFSSAAGTHSKARGMRL